MKFNCLECLSSLPLESLSISPDLLVDRDFDLLKNIKVPFLRGPADPEDQTAEDFFKNTKVNPVVSNYLESNLVQISFGI